MQKRLATVLVKLDSDGVLDLLTDEECVRIIKVCAAAVTASRKRVEPDFASTTLAELLEGLEEVVEEKKKK